MPLPALRYRFVQANVTMVNAPIVIARSEATWLSHAAGYVFAGAFQLSAIMLRDCHVGLRPPRNDKSGAGTVLTIACANRRFTAGRGMPLPYNAPSTAGSYIEPYTQRSISFPLF